MLNIARSLILRPKALIRWQSNDPSQVISSCQLLRESVQVLNDRYKGPLHKGTSQNTVLPFVFLLGNHSSGKSSFVNYVFNRKIQTSGVAPTDDSFTIIVPGPEDVDKDGPSFIGDPDMGFSTLRGFGPRLINHTQLKIRKDTSITDLMIVDSPGMIDSPMVKFGGGEQAVMHRGYDFEGVCKWFAERADVILLFFDPDKPGTTGETLQVLTSALTGLDHKLHIVLNKADQFKKIHDFARAYGSLCWNLSKVIHRKDLPRIYTMCLPPSYQSRGTADPSAERDSLGQGLIDLEATREDVVQEVLNAPKRRVDNEITRLADSIALLQIHCEVVDEAVKQYRTKLLQSRLAIAASSLVTAESASASVYLSTTSLFTAEIASVGVVATFAIYWYQRRVLEDTAKALVQSSSFEQSFRHLYSRQLVVKDEYFLSMWTRVAEHLRLGVTHEDIQRVERLRPADKTTLANILETELPKLRRGAAPAFFSPTTAFKKIAEVTK